MAENVRDYLHTYWIEFDLGGYPDQFSRQGYGVSAFDYADALQLLREKVFTEMPLPKVTSLVENVDVSTLAADTRTDRRGIWFPNKSTTTR